MAIAIVAAIFSVIGAGMLAPRSEAAFPGQNGRIAFQSNRDGNWEIYTMRDDGSDQTRLTTSSAYDGQPAISPNGRQIVFVRAPNGSAAATNRFGPLWIMNSDGSNQRQLTDRLSRNPAFSPDGKRVTFSSISYSGCAFNISWEEIFVMSAEGGTNQKLTSVCDPAFNPSFSPNGNEIYFEGKHFKNTPLGEEGVLWVDSRRAQPTSSPGIAVNLGHGRDAQLLGFSLGSTGSQWAYSLIDQGDGVRGARDLPDVYVSATPSIVCGCEHKNLLDRIIGSNRNVLFWNTDDQQPSFAPKGDWVAFERRPGDPGSDIFIGQNVPHIQGPQIRQLTSAGKNMAPDWGPKTP